LKCIGNEYDSVVAKDITDKNSGAKQVDKSLGESYKGLSLGTRSATTIFLYSFSGGHDRGATINEIKRSASILAIPSSAVSEAVDLIRDRLSTCSTREKRVFHKQAQPKQDTPHKNREHRRKRSKRNRDRAPEGGNKRRQTQNIRVAHAVKRHSGRLGLEADSPERKKHRRR